MDTKAKEGVSVVMTAYNEAKFIRKSITSILRQTYDNIELIIVDDGSVDGTVQIAKEFSSQYDNVRLFEKNHTGRADSLNIGLENASCRFVAINDADDVSHPTRIERQVNVLSSSSDTYLVGSKGKYKEVDGDNTWVWKPPLNGWLIRPYSLILMPIGHTTLMFKKDILENMEWYRDTYYIDYDFVVRAVNNYNAYNIDDVLVTILVHKDSVMGSESTYENIIKVVKSRYVASRKLFGRAHVFVSIPVVATVLVLSVINQFLKNK